VDCRTTTLHAEGGRLTGHSVLELLESHLIDAEAVGGLTMGAPGTLSPTPALLCCTAFWSARPRRHTAPAAASRASAAKARAW
jgi:hypothetical protein